MLRDQPNDPFEALRAAEARRRFHQFGTVAVLLAGVAFAVLLWSIPKQFHDQGEARIIMLAFITGLLAIALSIPVMGRLKREEAVRIKAVRKKEQELRGEALRRTVDEVRDRQRIVGEQSEQQSSLGEEISEGRWPRKLRWTIARRADEKAGEGAPNSRATLDRLSLSWVNLRNADLRGEDFRGAVLQGADLRGARLDSADLRKADLRDCRLEGASLDGVIYDRTTIWPASLDRKALETMRPEKKADAG